MILAIDPSIRTLGWAIRGFPISTTETGTIRPKRRELPYVLEEITKLLNRDVTCGEKPDILIVEYPQFFASSERGAVAAVDGTTLGLAAIAGHLQGYWQLPANHVFHYTPSEWKGQIPKEGMLYRFKKLYGYAAPNDHEAEAALLLDYHLKKHG